LSHEARAGSLSPVAGPILEALLALLGRHAGKLRVGVDRPGHDSVDTQVADARGRPVFVGMVKEGKAGVAFQLMAV